MEKQKGEFGSETLHPGKGQIRVCNHSRVILILFHVRCTAALNDPESFRGGFAFLEIRNHTV